MHVDVAGVERLVLVDSASATPTPLHVILKFGLHDAADSHNVTADTRIDQVILDFAIDCLRHLSRVEVLKIRVDLLEPESLKERGLRRVLHRIKNARAAVQTDAAIRLLPLPVDESELYERFAIIALELNRFNQDFDARHPQHCAAYADKLVDEVGLDAGHWVDLVVVVEADNHPALVLVFGQRIESD